MTIPKSELLLRQIRMLDQVMNPATPDATQVRQFRDMFKELDALLKMGGVLPPSWITPDAKILLKGHQTHTITDFDEPIEERLRKQGLAWCGHQFIPSTGYCNIKSCGNYIHSDKNKNPAKE